MHALLIPNPFLSILLDSVHRNVERIHSVSLLIIALSTGSTPVDSALDNQHFQPPQHNVDFTNLQL